MKEYKWNEDTINHFGIIFDGYSSEEMYNMIKEFVELNCQLEEGETEKDLVEDLINKIYKNKNHV